MRLINTKAHGYYDYLLSALLFLSPWVFHYNHDSAAYLTAVSIAFYLCILALLSRFELSIYKLLPMRIHFWCDYFAGILLAVSPWLFSFSDLVYKPHLVFGISLVVVAVLTDRLPSAIVLQLLGRGKGRSTDKTKQKLNNFQFIYERGSDLLIRHVKKVLRIPFR
jgi:hypothetical protein